MEAALDALRRTVCDPAARAAIGPRDLRDFAANCVVALAVGGHGSRLQSVTERVGVNKNALPIATGDTMIERTIRIYRAAGFHDFVALVFHQAESIVELLGDGDNLGVRIAYSHDPAMPVGRGGAIRNALANGSIPHAKSLIVHNPDDVIVNYPGSFPHDMVAAHLAGVGRGMIATAVMVEGARAPYTGMSIKGGVVDEVVAYPFVPIPAHIGVTLFSPSVYEYFIDLFSLEKKTDFEGVLFPLLAKERRLFSTLIPPECWLQVNEPKALDKLIEILRQEQGAASR